MRPLRRPPSSNATAAETPGSLLSWFLSDRVLMAVVVVLEVVAWIVSADRLRIARDLHDITAHGLSTIAIQSGVAAHLLGPDQVQAREALEAINVTGRRSLGRRATEKPLSSWCGHRGQMSS